jgi:hypothetical protein
MDAGSCGCEEEVIAGEEEAIRLLGSLVGGIGCLYWIVWRDSARLDDGWLIGAGYCAILGGGVGVVLLEPAWILVAATFAIAYSWRRRKLRRSQGK